MGRTCLEHIKLQQNETHAFFCMINPRGGPARNSLFCACVCVSLFEPTRTGDPTHTFQGSFLLSSLHWLHPDVWVAPAPAIKLLNGSLGSQPETH